MPDFFLNLYLFIFFRICSNAFIVHPCLHQSLLDSKHNENENDFTFSLLFVCQKNFLHHCWVVRSSLFLASNGDDMKMIDNGYLVYFIIRNHIKTSSPLFLCFVPILIHHVCYLPAIMSSIMWKMIFWYKMPWMTNLFLFYYYYANNYYAFVHWT